jgi:hypothetical protein
LIEADRQAIDVVRKAVVCENRWNRGEQADRRCHQRLGDAGRDMR